MDESQIRYPGWRVAAAASIGVFFASLVIVTFPVFLKPLSTEFSWSRGEVSKAFGIAAITAGLFAGPLGYLLDRVGPRRIAIPSLAVLGCAFSSLAWLTPHLGHLYAVFAVLGVAGIGTSPVAYGRAIVTWFAARRGLALALVITGGALGGVVHPPVTDALTRWLGWREACIVLGALVLVVGLPVAVLFVREHPSSRARHSESESGVTLLGGLFTRIFWILAAAQVCGTMVQNGVIVHLFALLTDRGVSSAQAAAALSAMAGAAVLGRLVTGMLIDRVFAPHVLVALMALAALGSYLLAGAQSFGSGMLAAMLVGFSIGGESDIVPYLLSRYFGLRSFSALYGFAWMANAIGGALGPVLMGRAFDIDESYEAILVRFGVVVAAAACLMLFLPRYSISPSRLGESVAP